MSIPDVACKHCSMARVELRQAIYRANRDVMKYGKADPSDVNRLKAEVQACRACSGTGRVPGSTTRRNVRRDATPIPVPKAKPPKPTPVIDLAAVEEALEAANRQVAKARASTSEKRPVTGYCHGCEKPIVWGRLFCGQCAAKRDTGGVKRKAS